MHLAEEGWYVDPYGRHEARWISDGTPTALVRDGDVEAKDPPPDEAPPRPLVRAEPGTAVGAVDMRRADEAEAGDGREAANASEGAWDVMGEVIPPS